MEHFRPFPMSALGRPEMLREEHHIALQAAVAVYDGDKKTDRENGNLALTNIRLLWYKEGDPAGNMCCFCSEIVSIDKTRGTLLGNKKIIVAFHDKSTVRFSFRGGGFEEFFAHVGSALARKPWLNIPPEAPPAVPTAPKGFSTLNAGVTGYVRKVEEADRATQNAITSAFQDMDTLMGYAASLVSIANRMQAARAKMSSEEGDEFDTMMLTIGLAAPVSQASCGVAFHRELSKELCAFLVEPLKKSAGTLSLVDVFCLYNRARGTDTVSPDDVLKACELFKTLNLPILFRKFDSGVMVVQSLNHSVASIRSTLLALFAEVPAVTGMAVAARLGVTLALATSYLNDAEQEGLLCRDVSVEGVAFSPNFFADPSLVPRLYDLVMARKQ